MRKHQITCDGCGKSILLNPSDGYETVSMRRVLVRIHGLDGDLQVCADGDYDLCRSCQKGLREAITPTRWRQALETP